jgi:hypothetical protein
MECVEMNIEKRKRCQNTISEQYGEYLKLTDDIFRSGKLTPTISPNYILKSWGKLSYTGVPELAPQRKQACADNKRDSKLTKINFLLAQITEL